MCLSAIPPSRNPAGRQLAMIPEHLLDLWQSECQLDCVVMSASSVALESALALRLEAEGSTPKTPTIVELLVLGLRQSEPECPAVLQRLLFHARCGGSALQFGASCALGIVLNGSSSPRKSSVAGRIHVSGAGIHVLRSGHPRGAVTKRVTPFEVR